MPVGLLSYDGLFSETKLYKSWPLIAQQIDSVNFSIQLQEFKCATSKLVHVLK